MKLRRIVCTELISDLYHFMLIAVLWEDICTNPRMTLVSRDCLYLSVFDINRFDTTSEKTVPSKALKEPACMECSIFSLFAVLCSMSCPLEHIPYCLLGISSSLIFDITISPPFIRTYFSPSSSQIILVQSFNLRFSPLAHVKISRYVNYRKLIMCGSGRNG